MTIKSKNEVSKRSRREKYNIDHLEWIFSSLTSPVLTQRQVAEK